ncbi:hypothetical protein HQ487_01135 [Candidatus Uhrbacteria bacterium]|nr:hypothetical protein [Candidatus Uhrbacteria bacterium]
MKSFQLFLFLVVVVLAGGIGILLWGSSLEEIPVAIEVHEEEELEGEDEAIESGAYLVFQSMDTNSFYRLELEDAGYQTTLSQEDLIKFASFTQDPDSSGSLTSYVFGKEIIMHRFSVVDGVEQDGILNLEGNVTEVRPGKWEMIRSENGRFEVTWESPYLEEQADILVTDLSTGFVIATIPPAILSEYEGPFFLEPFLVDDGEYLYFHEVCPCEATVSAIYQVDLSTLEVRRLDTLTQLRTWFLSSLDADARRLLTINTESRPNEMGLGDELLPPSTIQVVDLETLDITQVLFDEEHAWGHPLLEDVGDRYIVRLWDKDRQQYEIYLNQLDGGSMTQENYLTTGFVLDWVGNWLVLDVLDSDIYRLFNLESKQITEITIPGGYSSYVGSIHF